MNSDAKKSPARQAVPIDGMLVVYKPKGLTSRRVSTEITRKFGKMKIGHAGTLDPMAQGVLPILMGKATKLQDYIQTLTKSYRFCLKLGYQTDTLDSDGEVVDRAEVPPLSEHKLAEVIAAFTGPISQIPPLYSAVKFKGKPLYRYARSGNDSAVPLSDLSRKVTIETLTLVKFSGTEIWLDCTCSKGTYIRCLARDIAKALGTVATVTYLERTAAAGIAMAAAVPLDAVIADGFALTEHIMPLEHIPVSLPKLTIHEPNAERRLTQGQKVPVPVPAPRLGATVGGFQVGTKTMLLSASGTAFGVGEVRFNRGDELVIAMMRGL